MIPSFLLKYRKSKQFYLWFSSYIIILVLAIIINTIGYNVTLSFLTTEIEKNNKQAIKNISTVCDTRFAKTMDAAYSLLRSSTVVQLEKNSFDDYETSLNVERLLRDMQTGIMVSREVESCAVIYRNSDTCIHSDMGKSNIRLAYNAYFKKWFSSDTEWIDRIFSVLGSEVISIKGKTSDDIFVVYHIPNINKDIAVMAKLNIDSVRELLGEKNDNNIKNVLMDKNGNAIVCSDDNFSRLNLEFDENNGGVQKIYGIEYITTYVDSKVTPFRYVSMVESNTYLKSIKNIRLAFALSYILCLLIAGTIAWFFSIYNDRNKTKIDKELKKYKERAKESQLRQILTGERKLSEYEFIEQYPILSRSMFVVVLFDFLTELEENGTAVNYNQIHDYITGRFEQSYGNGEVYFYLINEMCVGILNISNATDMLNLKALADDICVSLESDANLMVRCSISRPAENPTQLNESYKQVIEIVNQRYLTGGKSVFLYDDIDLQYPRYIYTEEDKKHIISFMSAGDYESAKALVERIFDESSRQTPLNVQRILLSELVSTILCAAMQIDTDENIDLRRLYADIIQVNNYNKLSLAKKTIFEYIQEFCKISQQNMSMKSKSKYHKIVEYIEENYMDSMLNVNMISDVFKINRSWLSKSFREEIGITVSEYILKCRISRAKELLKTDKPVSQIAKEVGFSSEVVYYRAFKKCENITSYQYRQLLQTGKDDE